MEQLHRLIPVMLAALVMASPVHATAHESPRDTAQRMEALTSGGPHDPTATPGWALPNLDDQRDARDL